MGKMPMPLHCRPRWQSQWQRTPWYDRGPRPFPNVPAFILPCETVALDCAAAVGSGEEIHLPVGTTLPVKGFQIQDPWKMSMETASMTVLLGTRRKPPD